MFRDFMNFVDGMAPGRREALWIPLSGFNPRPVDYCVKGPLREVEARGLSFKY